MKEKGLLFRGAAVIAGVFLIGVAVGLFKLAEMGADPFTAMNSGISSALGVRFGTLQLGVNALLLVLVFCFRRQFIGFGTIINMVFVGYTADLLLWLAARAGLIPRELPVRAAVLAGAALLLCAGGALYLSAGLGMSPYDAAGYVAADLTGGRFSFRSTRVVLDVFCVAAAFCTGMQTGIHWKIVGVGTLLLALCTGPLIQFFRQRWSDPLLRRHTQ